MRQQVSAVMCPLCRKKDQPQVHEIVWRYCGKERIRVMRVKCGDCGRTFRVLPEFVVPYKTCQVGEMERVVSRWQEKHSYRATAKQVGMGEPQVRRWVRWWQVVKAVMEAKGLVGIVSRGQGWLGELLKEFWNWSSCCYCER